MIDRSSATIDIRPEGIEVEKLASVSSAAVGDPVQYTVRVTNIGRHLIDRLVIADNAMDGDPDKSITVEDFPDSADTHRCSVRTKRMNFSIRTRWFRRMMIRM